MLPAVPVFIWFRIQRFGELKFLLAMTSGVLSVLIAALIQSLFPSHIPDSMGSLLFYVFVHIALIEELSRFLCLYLLFRFFSFTRIPFPNNENETFFGMPSGLAAGVGFAAAETIFYSISDPAIAFHRLFTAVALHSACGLRIGAALGIFKKQPKAAFSMALTAILIHGMYNFFILNPNYPWFFAGLIALAALVSSLLNMAQTAKLYKR